MKTHDDNEIKKIDSNEVIQIAGAGPSGLAAAITLAKAGRQVQVHEAKKEVGFRFKSDLQGLENWTTKQDVLLWLEECGITTDFEKVASYHGTGFDNKGKTYEIGSDAPLFYMLERGPGPGSLDHALLTQAQDLGVDIHFNSKLRNIKGEGILATGPRGADAIAVGYHFETDMDNGFWFICDNNLAPGGYAYLLVMNGKGTVKSCMFSGFKQEKIYVERTVDAFKQRVGLEMINPRPHGGVGNFMLPLSAIHGRHPVVGEQAGFQDTLWGFGMRHAIASGMLAAKSLLSGSDYNTSWQKAFGAQIEVSIVNRALFSLMGNRGYRLCLRALSNSSQIRNALYRHYNPMWFKQLLLPWAKRRQKNQRKDTSCHSIDCTCVSCRCG